jgi:hypothetical protein
MSVGGITSALNAFDSLYKGKNNIDLSEFETWHRTTAGLINSQNVKSKT